MTAEQYYLEHGISDASIKKFGITHNKVRITIPIKDRNDDVLFNKYRYLSPEADMKFSYDPGSEATIFNEAVMEGSDYVFLTEGEMDTIRLDQERIAAVSNTSGASTFKKEWVELFEGKKVYIVYDNDKAGREGAKKVQEVLPNAYNIILPENYKDICEYFLDHTKKDFKKLVDAHVEAQTITYDKLCSKLDQWLLLPDKNIIKIFLASLAAHFFTTDPLWVFFVAPPSGSKTEIISTAIDLPFVHMLSDLTAQTLISGMAAKEDPSLLLKLKNDILIMKDFTTVLTMRREDRQVILSQLREIYDGRYSKAFGTGKKIEWEGRLTLIAGVTPIIDTHSSVFQVMGERFIMYRVPQPNDKEVARKALKNYGSEKQMREELSDAMMKFFNTLEIPHVNEIELPDDILNALATLAAFIVKARSGLVRNFRGELEYIPETEAPPRLAKQLGTLLKGLAVVERRKKVEWKDYYLVLKVALDAIPANRSKHLAALCGSIYSQKTSEIAQATDYSKSGSELVLEDLTALGLVKVTRGGQGQPNEWQLSNYTRNYFKEILPADSDEIYTVFTENHPYLPIIKEMLTGPLEVTKQMQENAELEETWRQNL